MADPDEADKDRAEFLRIAQGANPQLLVPATFLLNHAPAPLNTVAYLRNIFNEQDSAVRLLAELHDKIPPEDLEPTTTANSIQCDVWSHFGVLLMLQGKVHQAIEVFDALYARILCRQSAARRRFHKGLPLFHISQCYQTLGRMVHAKRHMMLALCEDAVSDKGSLNLQNTGSYGRLAWVFGLSDRQIREYATQAYAAYQENAVEASMPEWILQRFDQQWKTEIPSDQEAGTYHITKRYCEHLLGQLGGGDGRPWSVLRSTSSRRCRVAGPTSGAGRSQPTTMLSPRSRGRSRTSGPNLGGISSASARIVRRRRLHSPMWRNSAASSTP